MEVQIASLFVPEIRETLAAKDFKSTKRLLAEIGPVDLADGWSRFTEQEQLALFRLLPASQAIKLFEELQPDQQAFLISTWADDELGSLVQDLPPDEAARFFRKLPDRVVKKMTVLMKRDQMERTRKLLSYPAKTVGAIMRADLPSLKTTDTVRQALETIRFSTRLHTGSVIDHLYVTDSENRLAGGISMGMLVSAPLDYKLSDFMKLARLLKLTPEMDQEEAVKLFTKYRLSSAPVINGNSRLVGVVLAEDLLLVAEQETTEDITKMVGTKATDVTSRSVWQVTTIRFPWLIITWLGGLCVSAVVMGFQSTLSRIVALASFMPMIAAMGGNVGSQSATIVVRGLALGEIQPGGRRWVVLREMSVGTVLGVIYGVLLGAAAYGFYGSQHGWQFSVVVAGATMISLFVAASMGVVVPIVFKHYGIDPATATSPLITTTTDLISILSYFLLATYFLL